MTIDNKVQTDITDTRLSELLTMINDGELNPQPEFQRDYVYDDSRASKLVESVFLGIPIPNVFWCQEVDETYSVIDGQQRIVSLTNFLNNKLTLKNLKELKELNGKKYKQLDKVMQNKYKNYTLRCVKILKESSELKYEIFARLNQGAVKLKPQELRNCIYRGSFNEMLEKIASKNENTLKKLFLEDNKNKKYQEYILRFFAVADFSNYKSSLLKSMNNYMDTHKNESPANIKKLEKKFIDTFNLVKQVLGTSAFKAIDKSDGTDLNKFSGSIYDSIMVPFSMFKKHDIIKNADRIRKDINKLRKHDKNYRDAAYANSGSTKQVCIRITAVQSILNKYIKVDPHDDRRTFSIEEKKKLWKKGYKCAYCGNEILSIDDAEVDHKTAYSRGGKTNLKNAQLLHSFCNRVKSDSEIENNEWYEEEN